MFQLLLASSVPAPEALASWVEVLMYLIGCAAGFVGLLVGIKSLRSKPAASVPQPLRVSEEKEYTPLPLHRVLEERVDSLDERVEQRFIDAAKASADSRGKIYDLIRDQGVKIAALQADSASQTRSLHALDTKLDGLPERILRLVDRKTP
jgi:hypothetical protein